MKFINPFDIGVKRLPPLVSPSERWAIGLANWNIMQTLMSDASKARNIYTPERIHVACSKPPPSPNADQSMGPWLGPTRDLYIYGDDPDSSGFTFEFSGTESHGFRVRWPFDLRIERLSIENLSPMASETDVKRAGVFMVPMIGNPIGKQYGELVDVVTKGWWIGAYSNAGPVTSANEIMMSARGRRTSIAGDLCGISIHSDPNGGGMKSLHVTEGASVGTTKAPWSSHAIYIHAICNMLVDGARIHSWRSSDYGIQQWGSGNVGQKSKYAKIVNTIFEENGEGAAVITGVQGMTEIVGCRINSRTGIQVRGDVIISATSFRPVTPLGADGDPNKVIGTVGMVGPYAGDPAKVICDSLLFDLSEVGPALVTCFGAGSSPAISISARNCKAFWRASRYPGRKPPSIVMVGSHPNFGLPSTAVIDLDNCWIEAPDDLSNSSKNELAQPGHGLFRLRNCGMTGDATHDRGAIRLEPAIQNFNGIELDSVDLSGITRGAPFYVPANQLSKFILTGRTKVAVGALGVGRVKLTTKVVPMESYSADGRIGAKLSSGLATVDVVDGVLTLLTTANAYQVPHLVDPEIPGPLTPKPIRNIFIGDAVDTMAFIRQKVAIQFHGPVELQPGGNVGSGCRLDPGVHTFMLSDGGSWTKETP